MTSSCGRNIVLEARIIREEKEGEREGGIEGGRGKSFQASWHVVKANNF